MNCPLKKPPQFLDLQVGALDSEYPITPDHLSDEHSRRRKLLHAGVFRYILIFLRRLVDLNINPFKITENALNLGAHIVPIEATVARAEWRQSDRTNLVFPNNSP